MSLQKWASIAEIISGVAVVISLLLLVRGIQESSDLARVSVYADQMDGLNDWATMLVENPDAAELWGSYVDYDLKLDELDRDDRIRINQVVFSLFRNYEKAWLTYQSNVISEVEWERFSVVICPQFLRANSYSMGVDRILTQAFWDYMSLSCE